MNKKIMLVFAVLGILLLYFLTPFKDYLSHGNLQNLKLWIQSLGFFAPFIFILLYIVATVLCLPGSALTILAGLIFGAAFGTILVVIGSNIGALASFLITRLLGRHVAEKFLRGRVAKIDKSIKKNGFYVVLWLRLVPLFPFNVLNYALGLTKVTVKQYVLGNVLGMLPGTFVYVSLGNAASHFSLTDPSVWSRLEVWIVLSFLPKLFKKKHRQLQKMRTRS
ncbi:MAG: TVP38/TMEM64 family protein [Deltaproteobacteria bacterium]|nr:TVP38/TMEM64 family protein [Deltaproteobacteria bacterium]